MQLIIWSAIIVISVVLDQITKLFAVKYLLPIGSHELINGVIGLHYTENTGAAFGMLKGFRWVFIALSVAAIIAIIVFLFKWRKKIHPLLGIAFAMIAGGGIGNQIDRIANGFVVDFLEFQFIDFAIFNIADCFVTVGAVIVIIVILFIDKSLLSDDNKKKKAPVISENIENDNTAKTEPVGSAETNKTNVGNGENTAPDSDTVNGGDTGGNEK